MARTNNPASQSRKPKPRLPSSLQSSALRSSISKGKSTAHKNAAGYAKRLSRKAAAGGSARDLEDVYEYAPHSKVRRAKVKLDLDRDEMEMGGGAGSGSGSEDDDDDDGEIMRGGKKKSGGREPRLLGDDEELDSEDDEEIDSEGAFEESDEETYAGFPFRSAKPKAKGQRPSRPLEVDLNEDDEDERGSESGDEPDEDEPMQDSEDDDEDDGDGEFFDVLDVFDGKADDTEVQEPRKKLDQSKGHSADIGEDGNEYENGDSVDDEDENENDDKENDEASNSESDSISGSESDSPEALHSLTNFISSLDTTDTKKRKTPADDAQREADSRARKRRALNLALKERTEAGPEGEFGAGGATTDSQKLSLDDLLAPLTSSSSALASLKKSIKPLVNSSSKTKAKILSAPLPLRTQERLDREAAYEQTKEEVNKWSATMKHIRQAEHLSFPLQAQPAARVSGLELAARFKPTTPLETQVSSLLASAELSTEANITATESTALAQLALTPEEVAARRAELRTMRELAFRAEVKAKRVAKIKSKTFRRIRKKQREKLDGGDGVGARGNDDGDEDDDDDAARMKAEVARARERATLRHKHTGKWAQAMKERGQDGMDVDQRREIAEMLDRGEKLRRRIQGVGTDDEQGGGDSGSDASDEDAQDEESIKRRAFEELSRLETSATGMDENTPGTSSKSVFSMKFMRDAAARHELAAQSAMDDFAREMGINDEGHGSDSGVEELGDGNSNGDQTERTGVVVQRTANGGRVSFRPGARASAAEIVTAPNVTRAQNMGPPPSDTSSVTLQSADVAVMSPTIGTSSRVYRNGREDTDADGSEELLSHQASVNPWLAGASASSSAKVNMNTNTKAKNATLVQKSSSTQSKSAYKLGKQAARNEEARRAGVDDAKVEISVGEVLKAAAVVEGAGEAADDVPSKPKPKSTSQPGAQPKRKSNGVPAVHNPDDDSDVHSEIEEQEREMQIGKKGKAAQVKGKASGVKAFEQRDLVALAFAGDNVVQAFEESKRREIEEDAPRVVDTTLPGWGSWGGTGTTQRAPRPHLLKSIPGVTPTARADHAKPHLIISEKRDKKAGKYLVKELPHPYTSHAQFERAMGVPVGSEWNTRVGFQRGTVPRVVKKMGTVIDPLEKLF
ncbi:Utp14 protein-domain-containing protein [Hygrophoropsis aurantiaca]|uniref:Utp14 protein-domain-containing protein n=1 Tax=Hygrophoropsis aurantiaca TaxID=72124 RepID=A0ACB8ANM7_9AGAM|nr:Utp14 protein-domain-containing protein [Hygrophoropsis aurantiaca]